MKKTQITLALNALAMAGMLVFASQAANAASMKDSSPDPTPTAVHSTQSVADDATPDVTDTNEIADVSDTNGIENDVADISAEDLNLPDASEVDASTELELEQEGPSSN